MTSERAKRNKARAATREVAPPRLRIAWRRKPAPMTPQRAASR